MTTRKNLDATAFTKRGDISNTAFIKRGGHETDSTAPTISNVHCNQIGRTFAYIDWDTDEPANCDIAIDTDSTTDSWSINYGLHEHYVMSGRNFFCYNLTSNTTYYAKIMSADRQGNSTYVICTFKTASDSDGGSDIEIV